MKFVAFVGLFGLMTVSGCAGVEDIEKQIKQLRTDLYSVRSELYSEIRTQTGSLRDGLKKDMKDVDSGRMRDLDTLKGSLMKETDQLKKEADHLKDGQKRYASETDKTLIDYQKQIFQNRAVTDDVVKKVSLLESRMVSNPSVQKEGYVTSVSDNIVSVSLGSTDGVRAGNYFVVYKETNKIGVIKIDTIEANSSKGAVVNQEKAISIGDRVEREKEQ